MELIRKKDFILYDVKSFYIIFFFNCGNVSCKKAPTYIWSEEYQTELCSKHFQAFDILRKRGFFIGEFIWNFIDFKTEQSNI